MSNYFPDNFWDGDNNQFEAIILVGLLGIVGAAAAFVWAADRLYGLIRG